MKPWIALPIFLCGATALAPAAWSQTNTSDSAAWLVRLRSVETNFGRGSNAFTTNNFSFGRSAIHLSRNSATEIDVTHFIGGGLAVEVGYALPTKRNVTAVGGGSGSVETAQTTAMLQYHRKSFLTGLSTYVGAGFGSITTSKQNFALLNSNPVTLGSGSGVAFQLGLDYKLSETVVLNIDYKYLTANSDVKLSSNGNQLTSIKLDPSVFGIGIGVRF